uniref:C-type lectin domain-containing protein n=1 Tax=Cyclopterus lumpus TaxID=8103 RepID=A0A8C2WNF9_CYCLU
SSQIPVQALLIDMTSSASTPASSINPPPPTLSPCPEGYISWYLNCYKLVEVPATWDAAQMSCEQQGGNLVEFIRNLNYTKYHNVWIGLTRDRNCDDVFLFLFQLYLGWGWTDGTALGFLNWSPGEPNTAFHPGEVGEESCVEMYPDGRWNDNNCLQKRGFACRHIYILLYTNKNQTY